jgi:hypothetical protein
MAKAPSFIGPKLRCIPNPAFTLQAAPAVTGTFTNVPGATSPFTNQINGGQEFFRLIH